MGAKVLFPAFVVVLLCFSNLVFAQQSGIYLTAVDFSLGTTSYQQEGNRHYKLQLKESRGRRLILMVIGDSNITLCQDSVFGYRDDAGKSYRFYQGNTYLILNPQENILLYTVTTVIPGKTNQVFIDYFFSLNAGSAIYPLTKLYLKKALPNQSSFHELLDMYCHTDAELLTYDHFYNQYKINRIYQLSQQHE